MKTDLPSPGAARWRPLQSCRKGPAINRAPWMMILLWCFVAGCGPSEIKPVDIYPEDMCAYCRMAVSEVRCASEIVAESGETFKFDDISCLDAFRSARTEVKSAAIFVMDYERKTWIRWEQAVVIRTGVFTPMGSGKVAFADSARASQFVRQHPVMEE